jgi:hypothetical protein
MDQQAFAQLLGNYGEFIGSIAVVATLIYLSIQTRGIAQQVEQSQRMTETQIMHSNMDNANTWRRMVLDGDNADIWYRGINSLDSLEPPEKQRFFMMASAFDWFCWYIYTNQKRHGFMVDVNNELFRDQFRHPGYRQWMEANWRHHGDDYGIFLREVAASVGDETLRPGQVSSLSPGEY